MGAGADNEETPRVGSHLLATGEACDSSTIDRSPSRCHETVRMLRVGSMPSCPECRRDALRRAIEGATSLPS